MSMTYRFERYTVLPSRVAVHYLVTATRAGTDCFISTCRVILVVNKPLMGTGGLHVTREIKLKGIRSRDDFTD